MPYKNKKDKKAHNQKYYKKWYAKNGRERAANYQEAIEEWRKKHPKAIKVQKRLREAIEKGKIIRPKICSKCKRKVKISAHHPDYSRPLEVIWVCSSCHKKLHKITSKK